MINLIDVCRRMFELRASESKQKSFSVSDGLWFQMGLCRREKDDDDGDEEVCFLIVGKNIILNKIILFR